MRAVVQCVSHAAVVVEGRTVGEIPNGLLVYLGVQTGDAESDAQYIADKVRHLRVFPDDQSLMNRDVQQAGGTVLVVSAFTTAGDARKGRRPSFDHAAGADVADGFYRRVCQLLEERGLTVRTGQFGAMMDVRSTNVGPVCILLDSKRTF